MCKKQGRLRRLPEIECLFPKSVKEALSMLAKHNGSARMISGGTDVIIKLKRRDLAAKYIIDLKTIDDLNFIRNDLHELRIGAVTNMTDVLESPLVCNKFPIIKDALSALASPQIRNTASIVGNLCNAVPSADSAPPLIVLQAKLKVVNLQNERMVPVEDFFTGPGATVLAPGELVTEISIPAPPAPGAGTYIKHQLRAEMDLAIVGVGVYLSLDAKKSICKDARIALGAVAPVPMRARKAEDVLNGKALTDNLIETAAQIASEESKPIDDIRSSAEYRRTIAEVLTKRAIRQCLERV